MTVFRRWSLTFLVDGAPLIAVPAQQQARWVPGKVRFCAVVVLGADRASSRMPVRGGSERTGNKA